MNKDQAEKIRQILLGETEAAIRAERRTQWMFFALGLLASIPIGVAIELAHPVSGRQLMALCVTRRRLPPRPRSAVPASNHS